MHRVKDICNIIEDFAPLPYQYSYDNSGLIVGNREQLVSGILLTLDITEEVVDDAIKRNLNMIISHHPIIFGGLKKITGENYIERTIIKAIQNNICLYAAHTNLDNVSGGVSFRMAEKIGLNGCKVLSPEQDKLSKLVYFVPNDYVEQVQKSLFEIGCGNIGNYSHCSFSGQGVGTFQASELSNPFVGEIGKLHTEDEKRIETIFPSYLQEKVVNTLITTHPYEEAAYDIYPLKNKHPKIGSGCVGKLKKEEKTFDFLARIKKLFNLSTIKYTNVHTDYIKKVAVCGGSGSFLLKKSIASEADIFITGDFKYHDFFDAENKIIIADIGHYESEYCSLEIFYELITKKIPKFAIYFTDVNTNPVNYFL